MCGICGVLAMEGPLDLPPNTAERMIGVIRHRGPDEFGAWQNNSVFLGHARLSIIDPEGGQQPLSSRDGRCHITYNGEVFNYVELARELEARGHVFCTSSDTEVIVQAYLEWGVHCVDHFNGQFAFALWDQQEQSLFLARDRFGICPLFVAVHENKLLFASEIKSLKAYPGTGFELDGGGLAEVLSYWANPAPGTCFTGVSQLPAGHHALVRIPCANKGTENGLPACLDVKRYWTPTFLPDELEHRFVSKAERKVMARGLREKLTAATALRLRADVPVGTYLSGGLDSSVVTALARQKAPGELSSFGLGFAAEEYDERHWQQLMSDHLGIKLNAVDVDSDQLNASFREVFWHTESPLSRSAPAPLMALSNRVHANGGKVVLTGEGADEVLVGYNIFREAKVRHFWSRDPDSSLRPQLLTRLYPHAEKPPLQFLRSFYGKDLGNVDDPFYSHRPRWRNMSAAGFLCAEAQEAFAAGRSEERLAATLPAEFASWGPVPRAQYLEMTLFMSGYLLSSQGDRMLMANSVEGRFPFLDHELVEYAAGIPTAVKLQSLREKALFKDSVRDLIPAEIIARHKYPYRAPGNVGFKTPQGTALVQEFLIDDDEGWELWQRDRVTALLAKWRSGRLASTRDDQSFLSVLGGRVLQFEFGRNFQQRVTALALSPEQIIWRD